MTQRIITLLAAFVTLFFVAATATAAPAAQEQAEEDLLTIIENDDRLDSLEALVEAAALADELDQDGPFTIFAPTDTALEAFNGDTGEGTMTEVLLYHVINGYYDENSVKTHQSFTTLMGDHVDVNVVDGNTYLDGTAQIIESNIVATNGVIHLIDMVLIPEREGAGELETFSDVQELTDDDTIARSEAAAEQPTLSQFLLVDDRFDVLYGLLEQSDLMNTLEARNDFTLLAPTDAAFAELSLYRLDLLMNDASYLDAALLYHVVGDSISIDQIATDDYIPTLLPGRALFVEFENGVATVNGAEFTDGNFPVENGTVHVIDTVLSP